MFDMTSLCQRCYPHEAVGGNMLRQVLPCICLSGEAFAGGSLPEAVGFSKMRNHQPVLNTHHCLAGSILIRRGLLALGAKQTLVSTAAPPMALPEKSDGIQVAPPLASVPATGPPLASTPTNVGRKLSWVRDQPLYSSRDALLSSTA